MSKWREGWHKVLPTLSDSELEDAVAMRRKEIKEFQSLAALKGLNYMEMQVTLGCLVMALNEQSRRKGLFDNDVPS